MHQDNPRVAIEVIQKQLVKIPEILEFLIADLSETEWITRISDSNNMLGFIAWHIPSVEDFVVQSFIRGKGDVRHQTAWRTNGAIDTDTLPFGISLKEADQAALNTQPNVLIRYAYAVTDEIIGWLDTADDGVLSRTIDDVTLLRQSPGYRDVQFPDEISLILNRSVHDLLLSTCYGHLRSHFGEIETLKAQLRQAKV